MHSVHTSKIFMVRSYSRGELHALKLPAEMDLKSVQMMTFWILSDTLNGRYPFFHGDIFCLGLIHSQKEKLYT